MTKEEVITELKSKKDETIRRIFLRHGAPENVLGVRIQDLKVLQKKIRKNQELAAELYHSGISEAMYLAGLIGDGGKMTAAELNDWAKQAEWSMISDYTIPWLACEHPEAVDLALKWISSGDDMLQSTGWATFSSVVSTWADMDLDIPLLSRLLSQVEKEIHSSGNRSRYSMNGFVIAAGSYVKDLQEEALEVAGRIGKVTVDMGDTSCKVPLAADYIKKVASQGKTGRKRKEARC